MNLVNDTRALKMVRQFHNKRIIRFGLGREYKNLEDKDDLIRSQDIVSKIGEKLKNV